MINHYKWILGCKSWFLTYLKLNLSLIKSILTIITINLINHIFNNLMYYVLHDILFTVLSILNDY